MRLEFILCKQPKIYIIKKLLSTARPDMKRDIENIGTFMEKTVMPFPNKAIIFEKISTGSRPIESAIEPKICVPTTEPTKNIDWPIVDFHAESHTQFNCSKQKKRRYFGNRNKWILFNKNGNSITYFTAHTLVAVIIFVDPTIALTGVIFKSSCVRASVFCTWWIWIARIYFAYLIHCFICQRVIVAPEKQTIFCNY